MEAALDTSSFATAYAKAVIDFLVTDIPQGVHLDLKKADEFSAFPLEPGTSPEDVGLYVSDQWQLLTGPITVECDPKSADFSPELLQQAIVKALAGSAEAEAWIEHLVADANQLDARL